MNFESLLGGQAGYVGFTGATGGVTSIQTISNFSFSSGGNGTPQYANALSVDTAATGELNLGTAYTTAAQVGNLTLNAGATLNVTRSGSTTPNSTYAITAGSTTVAGNATINVANDGSGLGTLSLGALSGTGNLALGGPGGVILTADGSAFTGNATVNGGAIQLNNATALVNSTVTLSASSGLVFGSGITAPTLGGLAGAGNVVLQTSDSSAVTLTVGGNGQNTAYSGILSGSGSLHKVGSSSLTLQGPSTYVGGTTMNAGTLVAGQRLRLGPRFGTLTLNGGTLAGRGRRHHQRPGAGR